MSSTTSWPTRPDDEQEGVVGHGADGGGGQHREHDGDERAHGAAAAVEEGRDAVVDAALHEPGHGQVGGHADGDEQRRHHQGAVVRADEVAQQGAAARPEQPGQPAGDLIGVLDVDAAPRVDELVAGEVEGGGRVDVVDLVRFHGGHGALTSSTSSASSERTAR